MEIDAQTKSRAIFERARKVIPGSRPFTRAGMFGHYAPSASAPGFPIYFSRAEGSRFWDVDGNEYIDYMCAYGPMVLGYNHPAVVEAVREQNARSNTVSLASPLMVDLAEALVARIPMAEWVCFSKNGGDATDQAVMLARRATGRKKIVKIDGGYHGVAGWMQSPGAPGTTEEDHANVVEVAWNDFDALEQAVARNAGDVAGFISSPWHAPIVVDNALPAEGYWQRVEALCRREGIVLILDDVRAGFRAHLGGSNEYFGFRPDLICLGKALGGGEPIAALVGSDALRDAASSVFRTGSHFYNASPMAAALATLSELERVDGPARMIERGAKLGEGMRKSAARYGFDLRVTGLSSMPFFRIANEDSPVLAKGLAALHGGLHAEWTSECVKRGVFLTSYHNHFLSTAHTDEDLERTWQVVDAAFEALAARHATAGSPRVDRS
jgi:glutamate-1-semialdehyde 2,1-aminomutase